MNPTGRVSQYPNGTRLIVLDPLIESGDFMTKRTQSTKKVSSFPRDALEQAKIVKDGWKKVGGKLLVPNLSMSDFRRKLDEARQSVDKAEELKVERAKAIRDRNVHLSELWDLTKRIRNAAKATFGDYSRELDLLNRTIAELEHEQYDNSNDDGD